MKAEVQISPRSGNCMGGSCTKRRPGYRTVRMSSRMCSHTAWMSLTVNDRYEKPMSENAPQPPRGVTWSGDDH